MVPLHRCRFPVPMSSSATLPAPLSLPSGGGLLALIEMAASFLTRERLTAEERALLEQVQSLSDKYGTYLLEAGDREDLLSRVDAVLEDARFHEDSLSLSLLLDPRHIAESMQALRDEPEEDLRGSALVRALGPAATPALHKCNQYLAELGRCMSPLFQGATPVFELPAPGTIGPEPLAYLSDPAVPVPIARALLSAHRTNAVVMAIGAARFREQPIARWLGLALADLLAEQARGFLALMAAFTGTDVPASLLPPEERLDLLALQRSALSVQLAYARFNSDAERSGEPVYPSAS
ncbi:hypothetical protein K8638_28925 [Myxococcus sp. RHST-1-4]|nr:hypothetical protein [Myxococcus sp. RHSTA-1-4]